MTSVYVAASSADIDRAERWMAALRDAGKQVTSSWPANVRKVGAANPRHASDAERVVWSTNDLSQIANADVLWFLAPPLEMPTRGAWIEFGVAVARDIAVVSSGDTKQSIFCSLGVELLTDSDAFDWICRGGR